MKLIRNKTNFVGMGGANLGDAQGEVRATIQLKNGRAITTNFYVVKNITTYSPNVTAPTQWNIPTSQLADERFSEPGIIDALLGVGIWIQIVQPEIKRIRGNESSNQSLAQKTKLGYVIFEDFEDPYQQEEPYIGSIEQGPSIKELSELIEKLWAMEELPQHSMMTKEEEECETIFKNTHTRDSTGRYIVRIPFNEKINKLGKSKKAALHQFFAMEGRMKRTEEFASKYKAFITEYEALGHMTQIRDTEESGYYTPHHGVLSSGKFRVVFNASALTTSGISLNEAEMVGPKLQRDLFVILMNFRQYRIGITADIEKMYRQILVHKDDQKYQKILWRDNPHQPIKTYQLNTVTYGHSCAPHCAIRTLIQCAEDHQAEFPEAAKTIKECFYVDDLLAGAHNEQGAQEIKNQVTNLLERGKLHITKWKTNGRFCEKIELGPKNEPDLSSVLGLYWDLKTDTFIYKVQEDSTETEWTKRKILSKIGRLYDPNGYLAPIIMTGKMIMQDLWRDNLSWDEKIGQQLSKKWKAFYSDLGSIKDIAIKRWLGIQPGEEVQFHGFSDASEKGYGAVIYCRTKEGNGYRAEIIASKSRVAPIKVTTIPRLELCAASLLVKLMKIVIQTIGNFQTKTICWVDSQIVLHWISKPPANLKIYVANRVANIQDESEQLKAQWKWVAGEHNPADLVSRGTMPSELKKESKWWNGPEWLVNEETAWPVQPILSKDISSPESQREFKNVHFTSQSNQSIEGLTKGKWFKCDTTKQKTFPLLEAYGEWAKLLGVTTMLFRVCYNFKNLKNKKTGKVTPEDLDQATNFLIQLDQKTTFTKEVKIAEIEKRVTIGTLAAIWDEELKILRVDGRIKSANLTKNEQNPIILTKTGNLAALLIQHAHKATGHGGNQLVQQYLRNKYWIIGARKMTQKLVRQCPVCFRYRMATSKQLMAALPTSRTTPGKPFLRIGVDYAGPMTVRSNLGRFPKLTKCWIAVFVCLATRAIHLELVSSASTDAFMAAFRRLVARRGRVVEVRSDNGTNFVGASNLLNEIKEKGLINQTESDFNLKWIFTTPNAPHMGGIYESAVKSVKNHLVRIIGETTLTFEEYATILTQVEACVNSRPICALNDDPTDLNALTPGHFLIGEPLIKVPDVEDYQDKPVNRLDRWQHLQQMSQHFWQRWHHEYLNTLINRSKWTKERENIRQGDLVVVQEDNTPPMKWKMGRIQETLPGSDGLVRSVIVRTSSGVYKRPIARMGLLYSPQIEEDQ